MFKFGCNACGETWEIGLPRTCKCPDYFSKAKPKKREWVGLDEEDEIDWEEGGSLRDLVEAVEAKLKQKNGYAEEKNT